jgi:hypothetical protein
MIDQGIQEAHSAGAAIDQLGGEGAIGRTEIRGAAEGAIEGNVGIGTSIDGTERNKCRLTRRRGQVRQGMYPSSTTDNNTRQTEHQGSQLQRDPLQRHQSPQNQWQQHQPRSIATASTATRSIKINQDQSKSIEINQDQSKSIEINQYPRS